MATVTNTGLFIVEGSAAAADVAGSSQIWVKSDTPSSLYHTDDAGNDHRINGITLTAEQATTSGTSKDFLSIPPGTKKIIVMLKGVSTNGASGRYIVQLGDATGGIETSGYTGQAHNQTAASATANSSGFNVQQAADSAEEWHGSMLLVLENATTFSWMATGLFNDRASVTGSQMSGSKDLSHELDRVRLTNTAGETFDAGAVSIQYE